MAKIQKKGYIELKIHLKKIPNTDRPIGVDGERIVTRRHSDVMKAVLVAQILSSTFSHAGGDEGRIGGLGKQNVIGIKELQEQYRLYCSCSSLVPINIVLKRRTNNL